MLRLLLAAAAAAAWIGFNMGCCGGGGWIGM